MTARRFIYDDDGEKMVEGSEILVNSKHRRIIHFNDAGEIDLEDFNWEDVETIEYLKDGRHDEIEDALIDG